jgi:tetratricopeptide (TPR) repeat protein
VRASSLLFLFFLSSRAFAAESVQHDYSLHATAQSTPYYFIKTAAYRNPTLAKKALISSDTPLHMIYLKRYYSLVTEPFESLDDAKKKLSDIRKKAPDAYIITLYKREKGSTPTIKKEQTNEEASLMREGRKAYQAQRYEEALMLFDRILILNPDDLNAKFYYAATLYHLELYKESKKNFLQLQKSNLSPALRKEVDRYLDLLTHTKHAAKRYFNNFIAVGAGYDDNINLNTDKPYTQYGPYRLKNDTNKTKSAYMTLELLLSKRHTLGGYSVRTTLYSYNELLHRKSGDDLNFADLQTALLMKNGKIESALSVGANISYLGGTLISYNLYTAPQVDYALSESMHITGNLLLNDNHTPFADDRDYLLFGGGMGIRYRQTSYETRLNTGFFRYDAKVDRRYDINKDLFTSSLYLRYTIFSRVYLEGRVDYELHRYRDLDSVLGYKRKDHKNRYSIMLNRQIKKRQNLKAGYTYTNNHSNINLYAYDKSQYRLTYQYHF